jgi:hypothetical protein
LAVSLVMPDQRTAEILDFTSPSQLNSP